MTVVRPLIVVLGLVLAAREACAELPQFYWVAARFDPSADASAYLLALESDGQRRMVPIEYVEEVGDGSVWAYGFGGDPSSTTTVSVVAVGETGATAESNALDIAPTVPPCRMYDVNDDGQVTAVDALEVITVVAGSECE